MIGVVGRSGPDHNQKRLRTKTVTLEKVSHGSIFFRRKFYVSGKIERLVWWCRPYL